MACAVSAAPTEPQVSVSAGFDGMVPDSNTLIPLSITISNSVNSVKGHLRLRFQSAGSATNPELLESIPFDSPGRSVKRYTVLTRYQPGFRIRVLVDYEDKYADKSIQTTLRPQRKPMILALGPSSKTPVIAATKKQYSYVGMAAEEMPDDPRAYEAIHSVFLTGRGLLALEYQQIDALRDWMHTGGVILLQSEVPRETQYRTNLGKLLGPNAKSDLATSITSCGSGLLIKTDHKVWQPLDHGKYHKKSRLYTLFPLSKPKDPSDRSLSGMTLGTGSGFLNQFWIQKATDDSVGVFWLFLIVCSYLLFIGPIDFMITKRIKKPAFTWVLFLSGIVGFSFLAYGYTSLVNIGDMRAVQIQILDVSPHGGPAQGTGSYWLYSAKNATYELESTKKNLIFSGHESSKGVGKLAYVNIENGNALSTIETRIPIFSHKSFETSWIEDWTHSVVYQTNGNTRSLTLPPEINATHVYIGTKDGYFSLVQKGDSWGTTSRRPTSWQKLNKKVFDQQAYQQWGGGWGGYDSNQVTLPKTDALRTYLMQLSFPYFVDTGSHDIDPRYNMTRRELSLGLDHLMNAGRAVALIFVDPKDPFVSIDLSGGTPRQRTACVIRMALPKE